MGFFCLLRGKRHRLPADDTPARGDLGPTNAGREERRSEAAQSAAPSAPRPKAAAPALFPAPEPQSHRPSESLEPTAPSRRGVTQPSTSAHRTRQDYNSPQPPGAAPRLHRGAAWEARSLPPFCSAAARGPGPRLRPALGGAAAEARSQAGRRGREGEAARPSRAQRRGARRRPRLWRSVELFSAQVLSLPPAHGGSGGSPFSPLPGAAMAPALNRRLGAL